MVLEEVLVVMMVEICALNKAGKASTVGGDSSGCVAHQVLAVNVYWRKAIFG